MQESKLYVGNLSYGVTEAQLEELFKQHGTPKDVVVIKDKFTGKSKGFGFVEMSSPEEAQSAIDALNNTEFEGRSMRVNISTPKPQGNRRDGDSRRRY